MPFPGSPYRPREALDARTVPCHGDLTWTKLGTDILDPLTDLSAGAALAHIEALILSNRAGHDLRLPENRLKFLPHTPSPDEVRELIDQGWWRRDGTAYDISLRYGDWQLSADEVEKRRRATALRQERKRRHEDDDHSICLPKYCTKVRDVTRDSPVTPAGHGTAGHGTARQEEEAVPEPRTGTDDAGDYAPDDPWFGDTARARRNRERSEDQ